MNSYSVAHKLLMHRCYGLMVLLVVAQTIASTLPVCCQSPNTYMRARELAYVDNLAKDKPYKALDYLHEKLTREPDNTDMLFRAANLELELEQNKLSAKHFEHYIELVPKGQNPNAYVKLAYDYSLMGMPMKALVLYNRAIEIAPNHGAFYCERGCLYATQNRLDKAIIDLNKAIKLEPRKTHYYKERGEIFVKMKNYDAAAADFSSIIKMGDATAKIYSQRADAYKKMGKPDLAAKDLAQVNQFSMEMLDGMK